MYCLWCKKHNKTPFGCTVWNLTPCKRVRLPSVKDHEISHEHKDSVKLEIMSCMDVSAQLSKPVAVREDAMIQAFQCLYWLCKQRIPHTTNFEKLLDLATLLGLDIKGNISKGNNAKYTSNMAIAEFLECINEVLEQEILSELKASKHFSLMFDETTDCSVIEQLVIHCRYITESGDVRVRYCKILDALAKDSRPTGTDLDELDDHIITLNASTIKS